jgi:hypothetical protein
LNHESVPYQDQPLGVGIVGANSKRGWAKEAQARLSRAARRAQQLVHAEAIGQPLSLGLISPLRSGLPDHQVGRQNLQPDRFGVVQQAFPG